MKQSDADLDQPVLLLLYSVFFFFFKENGDAISLKGHSVMECRINTISFQYYVQTRLSIDIYRILLGPLSLFALQLLSLVLILVIFLFVLSRHQTLPCFQAGLSQPCWSLMSAIFPQLPSTVL